MQLLNPILVVDQDSAMSRMLAEQLGELDVRTTIASSVEEALVVLRARTFSVVLADLHMTPLDGFKLLELRPEPVPVVLMSAFPAPALPKEAILRGAAAFLSKPFHSKDLVRVLEVICLE